MCPPAELGCDLELTPSCGPPISTRSKFNLLYFFISISCAHPGKVKITLPEIVVLPVVISVSIQKTTGAWVRRIVIWLIATQAITRSVSVHVDVHFEAAAPVEVQKAQTAEMPGKHADRRSLETDYTVE
jgi:hypothetical protein